MVKTATRSVDLEPIDRLEDKVKRLVGLVERLRAEQAQSAEENQRLARELSELREQVSVGAAVNAELAALKEERTVIRSRVGEMLDQLEALNL